MTVQAITEREIAAKVARLANIREAKNQLEKEDKALTAEIATYLERTGRECIADRASGVTARLQPRQGSTRYDVLSMPDALVCRLKALGALSVDAKVVKALEGKAIEADDVRRYATPGRTTMALVLEHDGGR